VIVKSQGMIGIALQRFESADLILVVMVEADENI
jgi:hypothetical protein